MTIHKMNPKKSPYGSSEPEVVQNGRWLFVGKRQKLKLIRMKVTRLREHAINDTTKPAEKV
jgi:hypothetical protein